MHDTEKDIETKIQKWKKHGQFFLTTHNWFEKENSGTIQNLIIYIQLMAASHLTILVLCLLPSQPYQQPLQ